MGGQWIPPARDPYLDLADEAAHDAAVRARTDERSRIARAAEVATWVGTLRDLAERRAGVVIRTSAGHAHRGTIEAVALDHVAVRLPSGALVLLAADAVRTVRLEPGVPAPPAMGDRGEAQDRTLVEVLAQVAAEGAEVVLVVRDVDDPVHGELAGLGEDVATVRLRGSDRASVYVPVAAVVEVVLPA